jgi:hypothetical protein
VVEQVEAYKNFISNNKPEKIVEYYQKVWEIKKDLGLKIPEERPSSLAEKPLLLIFNRWTKSTSRRDEHTSRMKKILRNKDIDYKITSEI